MGAVQSTSLDTAACAEAFRVLAEDDALRDRMGASGRARAQSLYDWKHIIPAYEALWREQARKRQSTLPAPLPPDWAAAHPAYVNPFRMFESFPTRLLGPEDRLQVLVNHKECATLLMHDMNFFVPELLIPREQMPDLIDIVRRAGKPRVQDILNAFPAPEHNRLLRCLGWMLKHGICIVERVVL